MIEQQHDAHVKTFWAYWEIVAMTAIEVSKTLDEEFMNTKEPVNTYLYTLGFCTDGGSKI